MNRRTIAWCIFLLMCVAISAARARHLWNQQTRDRADLASFSGPCLEPDHLVVEGENLYMISAKTGFSRYQISNENAGLRLDVIHPGQCIRLPNK